MCSACAAVALIVWNVRAVGGAGDSMRRGLVQINLAPFSASKRQDKLSSGDPRRVGREATASTFRNMTWRRES